MVYIIRTRKFDPGPQSSFWGRVGSWFSPHALTENFHYLLRRIRQRASGDYSAQSLPEVKECKEVKLGSWNRHKLNKIHLYRKRIIIKVGRVGQKW